MKLFPKERVVSSTVVLALAAILVTLAALQYKWSRAVSEAASARMKASLQSSITGFRLDLYREFASLCLAFQPVDEVNSPKQQDELAQRYLAWARSAAHPDLVANIYILLGAGGNHPAVLRLNRASNQFEKAQWPAQFDQLSERLLSISAEMPFPNGDHRFAPDSHDRHGDELHIRRAETRIRMIGPWAVEENIPALVHPFFQAPDSPARGEHRLGVDWLVIEVNTTMLAQHILPELAERYFSGPEGLEYHVALIGNKGNPRYVSDPNFRSEDMAGADAVLNIFGAPLGPPPQIIGILLPGPTPGSPQERPGGPPAHEFHYHHEFGFGMPRFEPIHYAPEDRDWQLVVKHRGGSLEEVAASIRRRNLIISFGVLLVLAATMALIVAASRRAQRLARLQMDFVAGVSHELRTPLAVIASAADNIADGVVHSEQQLVRYGSVIKNQTRQLGHLVEQILLFAASRQHRPHLSLRSLEVQEVIGSALNNTAELLNGAGFTVEKNIEPNLPPVVGDLSALSHCLQNLISNAVKYSGEQHWLGIKARLVTDGTRRKHIEISVTDKGIGIESAELTHIFEPFYRGTRVVAAQIHGTGLGLSLAKSIAEAMGGRLTATSKRGQGSRFTLRLPVAEEAATADVAMVSASKSSSTSDQQA